MADGKTGKSDLGLRVVSAIVMVTVAGAALWLGGLAWKLFVAAVAAGVLWEWWGLISKGFSHLLARVLGMVGGIVYVCTAALVLARFRDFGIVVVLVPLAGVIATDIGAYFSGRAIGGPKIAPAISPSKTWSGLLGGMVAAGLAMVLIDRISGWNSHLPELLGLGASLAVVAQAGDFLESWLKRRAGVKDSGSLIPGHGGLLDRVDGLLSATCAYLAYLAAAVALGA